MKSLIVRLARRSLEISQHGRLNEPANFTASDVSRFMSPMAVMALQGDDSFRQLFSDKLLAMATTHWGIDAPGVPGNRLTDAFCMRSVTEAFKLLLAKDLIEHERIEPICRWLFDLASFRIDGRLESQPDFHAWQNRNQNVPATFIYEVAQLIEQSSWANTLDYQSLYRWADAQMTGWDLTWRSPDDAWLYQYIWAWSAYRHACIRRPDLLNSDNAIQSGRFYKTLYCPDNEPIVFGESNPTDYIAPVMGLLTGAVVGNDGQMVWLAQRMLERLDALGECEGLLSRGPEFHRLYTLVDQCPIAVPFERANSQYMTSPIAGRGWSIGSTTYNDSLKTNDTRFPALGKNLYDYDELYQIQDPSQYQTKPDKIVFRKCISPGSFFALIDLRAQGLHDHPDVPGVSLLTRDGLPWLLESTYMPREANRLRWLHNVPLYRTGHVDVKDLMSPQSDTWREPALDQVYFKTSAQHDEPAHDKIASGQRTPAKDLQADVARVIIPHDAFDYVTFDGHAFTLDRTFIYFHATDALLIIDRLISAIQGPATIAQAWHTPASVKLEAHGFELTQPAVANTKTAAHNSISNKHTHTLPVATASSLPLEDHQHQHMPTERGAFHYKSAINDLLLHAHVQSVPGQVFCMAAGFGIVPGQLQINQNQDTTHIRCANNAITLGLALDDIQLVELDPAVD